MIRPAIVQPFNHHLQSRQIILFISHGIQ
jgi:hypothetical protein